MLIFSVDSSPIEFQVGYLFLFHFFSVIDGFVWFWMGSCQKYPVITGFSHSCILVRTLYSRCGQALDLMQQPELASELEFDIQDMVDCGRK